MLSKIIPCAACQTNIELEDDYYLELIGTNIKCPSCNSDVFVYCSNDTPAQADAPAGPECSKCGKLNRVGSAFCVKCGAPLPQAQKMNTPTPRQSGPALGCPKCGTALRAGAVFCMKCGFKTARNRTPQAGDAERTRYTTHEHIRNKPLSYRTVYGTQESTADAACPHCANPLPSGAVLCVHCGTNLETKRQLSFASTPATTRVKTGKKSKRWEWVGVALIAYVVWRFGNPFVLLSDFLSGAASAPTHATSSKAEAGGLTSDEMAKGEQMEALISQYTYNKWNAKDYAYLFKAVNEGLSDTKAEAFLAAYIYLEINGNSLYRPSCVFRDKYSAPDEISEPWKRYENTLSLALMSRNLQLSDCPPALTSYMQSALRRMVELGWRGSGYN